MSTYPVSPFGNFATKISQINSLKENKFSNNPKILWRYYSTETELYSCWKYFYLLFSAGEGHMFLKYPLVMWEDRKLIF